MVRGSLAARGVAGVEDFGRFVSNVEFFGPSGFDERAAMPVLLELLPRVSDPQLVATIASHLRRPWARPAAFTALYDAFRRWAPRNESTGWAVGDAMASAARIQELPALLSVVGDPGFGPARQMVVFALARFKRSPDVPPALIALLHDPDVALHAMSALRRSVGARQALPYLHDVKTAHPDDELGQFAGREIRKAEKTLRSERS
jgi:hypothetical protein